MSRPAPTNRSVGVFNTHQRVRDSYIVFFTTSTFTFTFRLLLLQREAGPGGDVLHHPLRVGVHGEFAPVAADMPPDSLRGTRNVAKGDRDFDVLLYIFGHILETTGRKATFFAISSRRGQPVTE